MLSDFNKENLLEEIQKRNDRKDLHKKTMEIIHELNIKERITHSKLNRLEDKSTQLAMVEYKKLNIFSKIANFFHFGDFYNKTQQNNQEISKVNKELAELDQQINYLDQKATAIKGNYWGDKAGFEVRGGELIINDKGFVKAETEFEFVNQDAVLVHCTDSFPKNHTILSDYEQHRIAESDLTYHGVTKKVKAPSTRREVHFTINNRMRTIDVGKGNNDNPKYMILDDLETNRSITENFDVADSWTKGLNIKLSENALILIDYNQKDDLDISEDELKDYNILYFDGEPTKCLSNFLTSAKCPVYTMDLNAPISAETTRMRVEHAEFCRNLVLNYMSDNSYQSSEIGELSEEDAIRMLDIATDQYNNLLSPTQLRRLGISEENFAYIEDFDKAFNLVNFITASGFYKLDNGNYGFKPYNEILENASILEENPEESPDFIDKDFMAEMFGKVQVLKARDAKIPRVRIDEANSLSFKDLYKFENQTAAETIFRTIDKTKISFELLENGAVLSKFLPLNKVDLSENDKADNIDFVLQGLDYGNLQTEFDGDQKPDIIQDAIKKIEDKFNEISEEPEKADDYIR